MRSGEIESLQQGTVTGKQEIILNDEPTDGRLIYVSGPRYVSSHRRPKHHAVCGI